MRQSPTMGVPGAAPCCRFDYRVSLGIGEALHMHIAGCGEYDTGVFAYNLVKHNPDRNPCAMFTMTR
jgi:hypothetical protein